MKSMKNLPLIKKRDIAVILILLAACFMLLLLFRQRDNGTSAIISVNGKTVAAIDLSSAKDGNFTLDSVQGVSFEIKSHEIRIKESDCNDKICVRTGFIGKSGESAVCLPKKLVVTIKNSPGGFDAVAG